MSAPVCASESCRKLLTNAIGGGSSPSAARTIGGWSIIIRTQATARQVFFMAFSFEPLVHLAASRYDTAAVSSEMSGDATKGCRAMNRAELEQQLEEPHPVSFAWGWGCCGRGRGAPEQV